MTQYINLDARTLSNTAGTSNQQSLNTMALKQTLVLHAMSNQSKTRIEQATDGQEKPPCPQPWNAHGCELESLALRVYALSKAPGIMARRWPMQSSGPSLT